ncbi:MAG TPA: OmpA family protein [Desulfuromonadaceae bacterium]|jgi:chemotaxis protein MotB
MALRREPEKHANHERWLVSYGDLLTLMLAVFVVLYAMSQADKKKTEEVSRSIQSSFGMATADSSSPKINVISSTQINPIPDIKSALAVTPGSKARSGSWRTRPKAAEPDFLQIKSSIEAFLVKEGAQNKVNVELTRRGVVVSLKEAGFFNSGSAFLKKESEVILSAIAEALNRYSNTFRVEGHTDNVPIHSGEFRSNWELSTMRATNVLHYLIDASGISPESVSAVGFGEYRPITDNDTSEGRQKNRRVDIVLLAGEAEVAEPAHNLQLDKVRIITLKQ